MLGVGVDGYPGHKGFAWPGFIFPGRAGSSKDYFCPNDFFGIFADIVYKKHRRHFSKQLVYQEKQS